MANLTLTGAPGNGLLHYQLTVDGQEVPASGNIEIPGQCGDGSAHELCYALFGPVGATLVITVKCDGATIGTTNAITVFEEGEPAAAGCQEFVL